MVKQHKNVQYTYLCSLAKNAATQSIVLKMMEGQSRLSSGRKALKLNDSTRNVEPKVMWERGNKQTYTSGITFQLNEPKRTPIRMI